MNLDELKQILHIESWQEIQLVFYVLGIYYGFISLRWLANKFDRRDTNHSHSSEIFTPSNYHSGTQSMGRHTTSAHKSEVSGKAIISKFNYSAKYVWDGRYLSRFSGTKLFEFDGEYVSKFSGTKIYRWDGKVLSPFSGTGKYSVAGNAISVFSGTKLYTFDNLGISKFSGTRLYSIKGDIDLPVPLMIMIAERLQGL